MDFSGMTVDARRCAERAAIHSPNPATVARWGLGAMLIAAGAHKLLDPAAWAAYVTAWLTPWLIMSPIEFMLVNGWFELGFGALLLANRYTAFAAAVAFVSLTATTAYLVVVWVTTGAFGDIIARDIGLAGLAWTVLTSALREQQV